MESNKHIDDYIIPMHVEKASDTILQSDYGLHALVVYSDMTTLREFWSFYTKKSIEENNELVCLAPFYDTVESVRNTLSSEHVSIDVQKHETNEKSLIIVDSLEKYLGKNAVTFDVNCLLKSNQDLVEYGKELKKNGVSLLGDSGAFLYKNQIQNLIDYESSLPTEFDINLKGVCLYHQKDFDRLSQDQKLNIIKHHQLAIKI